MPTADEVLRTDFRLPAAARDAAVERVHLVFNVSHARALEPLAPGNGDGLAGAGARGPAGGHVLSLAGEGLSTAEHAAVLSRVERPELVKFVVERREGERTRLVTLANLARTCTDTVDLWEKPASAAELEFGPLQYHNALDRALGPEKTPVARYRRFFFDLDRRYDEKLAEIYLSAVDGRACQQLRLHLAPALGALGRRIAHRFAEHQRGAREVSVPAYGESVVNALGFFSSELLATFLKHFPTPSGLVDLDAFEEAFEMFANGELRLRLPEPELAWTTQPSSGLYFYFAEFALLAAELGIQRETWTRLANVLVRSQRIYCDVYPPRAAETPAKLSSYWACGYAPQRAWVGAQKAALRREFDGLELGELAVAAAQHTLAFMPAGV